MKKRYFAKAAVFFALSVGPLTGACLLHTREDRAMLKEAKAFLEPYYAAHYENRVYFSAAHKINWFDDYIKDHGYQVTYEIWQGQPKLGVHYTYAKITGFDTEQYPFSSHYQWERWLLRNGEWSSQGYEEPVKVEKPKYLGSFTLDIPQIELHRQTVDQAVYQEMIDALTPWVAQAHPEFAEHEPMFALLNTEELYAVLVLEYRDLWGWSLKDYKAYNAQRVQLERNAGGELAVAGTIDYHEDDLSLGRRAYYTDIVACNDCQALLDPNGEAGKAQMRAVLLENGTFLKENTDEQLTLDQVRAMITDDPNVTVTPLRFAFLPMDDHGLYDSTPRGMPEMVIELDVGGVDGASLVLRRSDGVLRGYVRSYRGMHDLKEDGTFSFSGGAADSGYGRISFFSDELVDKYVWSESSWNDAGEQEVTYWNAYLEDWERTQEEFDSDMAYQAGKPDALWYDITAENIDTVFANTLS